MNVRADVLARARTTGYRMFYHLPFRWRHAMVRMVSTKYTVGAVTLVRDADAPEPGRLLLLRQPPNRGWTLPGGLLKANEEPVVGAARELAEESGLDLDASALRPAVPNAIVHPDGRWVDMVFEASVPADTTFAVDGGEVLEAAWHPLDDLPRLSRQTSRLLGYYGIGPHAHRRTAPAGAGDGTPAPADGADGAAAAGGSGGE